MCRRCTNFDTCPHKKMEAARYSIDADKSVIKAASTLVTRDDVILSLYPNINPVEMEGLKKELDKVNEELYPVFLRNTFNVEVSKMNRNELIEKSKVIKANGNMLGLRKTNLYQEPPELIIIEPEGIDAKVEYYSNIYDENLVHPLNKDIRIVEILEITQIRAKSRDEAKQ